jgi:hypothetical protein
MIIELFNSPCPTPTPTQTTTQTNTPTPTNTATNTSTPTPTPTQPSGTTEANAYLTAVVNAGGTGITSTVSAATRTLFTSIVSNGLYDKVLAFYPMLGGNSSGCKFNGKNPLDTNAAYRLVFNGGWTFNSSGATSNGTNAFANTYFSASTITPLNSQHYSVYMSNNNVPADARSYLGGSNGTVYNLIAQVNNTQYYYGVSDVGASFSTTLNTQGNLTIASSGGTRNQLFRNGTLLSSTVAGTYTAINFPTFIAALNNGGTTIQYYNNQYSFATLGSGLSATEVATLSTIINTFQTTLSRNTY